MNKLLFMICILIILSSCSVMTEEEKTTLYDEAFQEGYEQAKEEQKITKDTFDQNVKCREIGEKFLEEFKKVRTHKEFSDTETIFNEELNSCFIFTHALEEDTGLVIEQIHNSVTGEYISSSVFPFTYYGWNLEDEDQKETIERMEKQKEIFYEKKREIFGN